MAAFFRTFRDGSWVTQERVRLVALILLLASLAGVIFLVATSIGRVDVMGRPLGTDFSNIYAAGTYVLEGRPAAPFDPKAQLERERELFGDPDGLYGWHYPPFFLPVAAALARMPYPLALAVWQGVTLALYLLSLRAIIAIMTTPDARGRTMPPDGKLWLLLALAYPAVFVNLGHGHNGFLTASLLGFALAFLDRRPLLAGLMFGLLAYKPQFGMMIPLALIADGRWRTFGAAAATVVALTIATLLAFGLAPWTAFFASMEFVRHAVLEQGGIGWHKIQSVFAAVRLLGGSVPFAYAAQGAAALASAAAIAWLWHSRADPALKAAALAVASMLATPYGLDYDMMMLAPALAFLILYGRRCGFAPWEKSALAILWIAPLVARSLAQYAHIPFGTIAMIIVLILVLRRSAMDASSRTAEEPIIAS
jgi:alpha-1,2-mannosyltransferase